MKTTGLCILLFIYWEIICCHSCELSNITIALEKEECNFCISVTAAWCSGSCMTKDPVDKGFLRRQVQKICTYQNVEYRTVMVPGCDGYEESIYHYPVATECHCSLCDTDTTDCTVRGIEPDYCSFGQDQFKL